MLLRVGNDIGLAQFTRISTGRGTARTIWSLSGKGVIPHGTPVTIVGPVEDWEIESLRDAGYPIANQARVEQARRVRRADWP